MSSCYALNPEDMNSHHNDIKYYYGGYAEPPD